MGKHAKKGKQRKDKFYKLAKETGFRSRASFKLLQLNRKFEFLQKSRVLVDLCAAPGGWLQVAQQSMPVSAIIIGVDLVSIKPIPNVITFQEDITTDKCRQTIKRHLKTWKADVVLHDGAPNVGRSWTHDAFAQAHLTLSALKLASEILMPNGWFITKVFRSKDYNALLWVFGKLFKKVHVTKPQASRNESAEIFVICEGYVAPDKIDPKFLDSAYLFQDVEAKADSKKLLLQNPLKKKKAEGYEAGDKSVYSKLKASEFIFSENYVELLANCTEIIFDDDDIRDHRTTNADIKEYCMDIKVLGKREIKALLKWRAKLHDSIKKVEEMENTTEGHSEKESGDAEEAEIENAIAEAKELEFTKFKELKKKKKQMLKGRRKIRERMDLKMIIQDDEPIIDEDRELFSIKKVINKQQLMKLEDSNTVLKDDDENDMEAEEFPLFRGTYVSYNKEEENARLFHAKDAEKDVPKESSDSEDEDMEFETVQNHGSDEDELSDLSEEDNEPKNPLLLGLASSDEIVNDAVSRWFDKKDLKDIEDEDDLDLELLTEKMEQKTSAKESTPVVPESVKLKSILKNTKKKEESVLEDESDEESEDPVPKEQPKKKKKRVKLDPEGLALGTMMIKSKKSKRDIMDDAYNRYANNDENLPQWFVEDEQKHNKKQLPVTAEMIREYRQQLKEINARPVRKVIEAKARKKRRALRRMEKARKRAEAVTENLDMSEKEKVAQLKSIYKKALPKKDTKVTYVVAKKGTARRPKHRPEGRYKIVDKRMKKDNHRKKEEMKTQKRPNRRAKVNKKKK